MPEPTPNQLLDEIIQLARAAGEVVMEVYNSDFDVRQKDDRSPVTDADEAAEAIITPGLRALLPDVPVVAEEAASAGLAPETVGNRFWLVDPVDGTKEFIRRNGEFTVNIALIEDQKPVLGVVYAPALGDLYTGAPSGAALSRNGDASTPIQVRSVPAEGAVIVASRSHGDPEKLAELTGSIKVQAQRTAGSSLKFCLLATGEADLYPRYGPTCEWDTAAGHAVLDAAGGSVRTLEDTPFLYGKENFLNPPFFARGRKD